MKKKKTDPISRRVFITDTGKTLFYTTLAASVLPTVLMTGCSKGGSTGSSSSQGGNLTVSEDGMKKACAHEFICIGDSYECGKGSFNCNHCFYCDDDFNCAGPKFHCHNDGYDCGNDEYACAGEYNCFHEGGAGGG